MKHRTTLAFSLIELSVVLLIMGVMLGGIMAIMTQETRRTKQGELNMKMDAIETALASFVRRNNRLPCPADGSYAITSTYFGIAALPTLSATTSCVTGATYTNGFRTVNPSPPTANAYSNNVVGGVVPVRSLGLPDEYMFDPWGGRFTYAADIRLTTSFDGVSAISPFIMYPPDSASIGSITVNDINGAQRTSAAVAVVLSHGANGHGAFQLSGTRKNAGSTNAAGEQENCDCNTSATTATFNQSFVQHGNTATTNLLNSFDDVTRYYTRGSFLILEDTASEN